MTQPLTIRPRTALAVATLTAAAFAAILIMGPASAQHCDPPTTTTTTAPTTTTTAPTTTTTTDPGPTSPATYTDVAYGPHTRQVLDLTIPAGPGPFPVIVFAHGGGWVRGDKSSTPFDDGWVDDGYALASFNYRYGNGGTVTYAEMLDDVAAAWNLIASGTIDPRVDPDRMAMTGYSAGAHLSALATVTDHIDPAGVVTWGGPFELAATPRVMALAGDITDAQADAAAAGVFPVLGCNVWDCTTGADVAASATLQVQGDEAPFHIVHGTADRTVPYVQSEWMGAALPDATVELLAGGNHRMYLTTPVRRFLADVTNQT